MIYNLIMFLCYLMTLSSIIFIFNNSNFLSSLVILELMVMHNYFVILIFMNCYSFHIIMYFLILSVCESALGLSILVKCVRMFNNSLFKSMNCSVC